MYVHSANTGGRSGAYLRPGMQYDGGHVLGLYGRQWLGRMLWSYTWGGTSTSTTYEFKRFFNSLESWYKDLFVLQSSKLKKREPNKCL